MHMEHAKIYKDVDLGENVRIQDFVSLGIPPSHGVKRTVIGDHALIRSNTVIYAGNVIGKNFTTGHGAVVRENNRIGNNVKIGTFSVLEGHCAIADNVTIHSHCFIGEYTQCQKNVWIGPCCSILNTRYPKIKRTPDLSPCVIEEGAIIGANTILLPGVTVGKNALIGAGSLVTKSIPAGMLAYGRPAAVIKPFAKRQADL